MATLEELVDGYKRVIVERTLIENDYDRQKVAEALGLTRQGLWQLLRKYKIKAPFGHRAIRRGWQSQRKMHSPTLAEQKRKRELDAEYEANWVEPPLDD